jgi:hypothetical protein
MAGKELLGSKISNECKEDVAMELLSAPEGAYEM